MQGLNKEKVKHVSLVCVAVVLLAYIVLKNVRELDQIIVINDEFGYWANAAQISGKKWDFLLSMTPFYSYGYSILLVPLFWLIKIPSKMYAVAIIGNVIVLLVSFGGSMYIIKHLFPKFTFVQRWFIALLTTLYVNNLMQSQSAWTENLLYMLVIICCCFLIKVCEKMTITNFICLVLVALYAYMVHQRALVLIIALGLTFLAMLFKGKLSGKVIGGIFATIIVGIIILYITKNIVLSFYGNNSLVGINDYSGQTGKISGIFTIDGLILFLKNYLGSIFYLSIASYGLIPIGVIFCCKKFIFSFKEKNSTFYFYLSCLLIYFGAIALSSIFIGKPTRLDMIMYGRYVDYIVAPFLIFGLISICENRKIIFDILIIIVINIGIGMLINTNIKQFSISSYNIFGSAGISKYIYGRDITDSIVRDMILQTGIVILAIGIFRCIFNKKNIIFATCIIAILWINQFNQYIDFTILPMQESRRTNLKPIADYIMDEKDDLSVMMVYDDMHGTERYTQEVEDINLKYIQFLMPDTIITGNKFSRINNYSGYILVLSDSLLLQDYMEKDNLYLCIQTETYCLFMCE